MALPCLEITQINLQHSKDATALLCCVLTKLQTGIALIQEPWVYKGKIRGMMMKGSLFCSTSHEVPRACIFASPGINAVMLPGLTSRDLVAVQVEYQLQGQRRKIIFASVYLPFDSETPPPSREMENLIEFCRLNGLAAILGCDANSHNLIWGSTDTNARGQSLLDYLVTTDLEILNVGHEPTFVVPHRQQVIDISLASHTISQEIGGWHVSSEVSLSDHRYIKFKLQVDPVPMAQYRNPRSTDWDIYYRCLAAQLGVRESRVKTVEELEQEVAAVTQSITAAFQEACPLRKAKGKRQVPWWNPDLSVLRRGARRAEKRVLQTPNEQNQAEHRVARRDYKRAIRVAKRESWRLFCGDIQGAPASARLHRILSRDRVSQPGILQLPSGEFTSNSEGTLTHLLQVHFPGSTNARLVEPEQRHQGVSTWRNWEVAARVVTSSRIDWAIKSFAPFKSAGEDGIFPALLQRGLDLLIATLCKIFRACLALGHIPVPWQTAKVVFIPKPGRSSYQVAKAFRPISLTSFLLKTVEKMVDRYLRDTSVLRYPLHNGQHAYQAGKSTDSALHCLVRRVERALHRKQFALGVFMDIEGAFDSATYGSMINALRQKAVDPVLCTWVKNLLNQRQVCAKLGNYSKRVYVHQGCPQGGVLSPLLWNLIVDSLLQDLNDARLYAQGYSDDVVVLLEGFDLGTLCNLMQGALTRVQRWCDDQQLSVNPRKTEAVLFTHKRKLEGFHQLTLYGQRLELTPQVKFLGVILDNKLSWKAHIEHKYKKATAALWQCRRAVGKTWGLTPKVAYWMYTMIIRPMVSYAAVVWWPRTELVTAKAKLGRIQRLGCLNVTGAIRTTPTAALEVLLDLPPLDLYVRCEAMATSSRLCRIGQWKQYGMGVGHSEANNRAGQQISVLGLRSDHTIPKYYFDKRFKVLFPTREEWTEQQVTEEDCLSCFTDGSRMANSSGAGVFISQEGADNLSVPLGEYATVFQAEVYAILSCINSETVRNFEGREIRICSDSQAALKALAAPKVSSRLVAECRRAMDSLTADKVVTLVWVPGHSGIEGNEQADKLARTGSQTPFIGPEPVFGTSLQVCRLALKKWVRNQHLQGWQERDGCRQGKELIEGPNPRVTHRLLQMSRKHLRLVVGVLTGHCGLNRHLNLMRVVPDPLCALCAEEEETAFHFLGQCVALAATRRRILGADPMSPQDIRRLPIGNLLRFIKESKRFPEA